MSTTPTADAVYLDPARSVDERVDDLVSRMTIEEKAGQLFHTMAVFSEGTPPTQPADFIGKPAPSQMISDRHMTHFNMLGVGTGSGMATWHNQLQDIALETRLRIPITLSSDPRHGFGTNLGTSLATAAFSSWPEPLGLAMLDDEAVVEQFADISRQELLAVGIRLALHPQLDLATEPRWARTYGTFGDDPERVARLGTAYVRGLRADRLGPQSVAAMIKHFPGNGPVENGEDPHFAHGKRQVYPGGGFEDHLAPFRAVLAAGASQVMPSYGVPIGAEHDEVGCGFNRSLITDLLRGDLGFDGVVCTDWGLITDSSFFGEPMPARAWGVEHLDPAGRVAMALDAGVDQFGGEHCAELVIELVESGVVTEQRVDASVRRLLRQKFELGLFDRRHVDADAADEIVGAEPFRSAGRRAQSQAVTVLRNDGGLPLRRDQRLHVNGLDAEVASSWTTVVEDHVNADATIVRIPAPFEQRPGAFESMFHSGSLEFPPEEVDRVRRLLRDGPSVLVVNLDRPAVVSPFVDHAEALVVCAGCSDEALLDALFGHVPPRGRLPVALPASMAAVEASPSDLPIVDEHALFPTGAGVDVETTS